MSNCSKCNCSKRERVLTPCLYCPGNNVAYYTHNCSVFVKVSETVRGAPVSVCICSPKANSCGRFHCFFPITPTKRAPRNECLLPFVAKTVELAWIAWLHWKFRNWSLKVSAALRENEILSLTCARAQGGMACYVNTWCEFGMSWHDCKKRRSRCHLAD